MFLTLKIFWRMFFSVSMIQWTKKWRVHAPVCQEIILLWYRPHIDVFATSLELETYVSLIPEGKAWVVDHMTLSWQDIFSCMFPSFRLLPNILHEIQSDLCKAIIIAPAWQRQSRFKQLLFFVVQCRGEFRHLTIYSLGSRGKKSSGSTESPSARLFAVMNSLRNGGFYEEATKRITGSIWQSTGTVYDSKWSIFCARYQSKQFDSFSVTVQNIVSFLKKKVTLLYKGIYICHSQNHICLSGGSDFVW